MKALLLTSLLFASLALASAKLEIKPINASPTGFDVNATLITGEKDAVLIDGAFTQADAHRIVAEVLDSKKNLTTIYVTHSHPDHYFGLDVVHAAFPSAKIVALPATIAEIKKTAKGKVDSWKPIYGANVTDKPVVPEPLVGNSILLEGETLEVHGGVQGDSLESSYVWVPSRKAVIAGDTVFNGVHVWTAETKVAARKAWLATLEKLDALKPEIVVPGHRSADAKDDASGIAFTRDYLKKFDESLASSKNAEQLLAQLKTKFPKAELEIIAKIGSDAQFAK